MFDGNHGAVAGDEQADPMEHQQQVQKDDVQKLLQMWGLSDLRLKFKEHEVCIRSLQCLTEHDISELIPKIGRRAIFRSRLLDWHKQNASSRTQSVVGKKLLTYSHHADSLSLPPAIVKVESGYEDDDTGYDVETELKTNRIMSISERTSTPPASDFLSIGIHESSANPDHNVSISEPDTEPAPEAKLYSPQENPTELSSSLSTQATTNLRRSSTYDPDAHIDIWTALTKHYQGRQAMQHYETNGKLDFTSRRKIVSVIINLAIEKKVWMCTKEFKRIAREIVKMFPNESYRTYYIPRDGTQNPRGALYNKFLNVSRKLRQEGLLDYRINKLNFSYALMRKRPTS